jgi:alpha-tubulin suppressor-like RCC1 family protein
MKLHIVYVFVLLIKCFALQASAQTWITWGAFLPDCMPLSLSNIVSISAEGTSVSALTEGGNVINWEATLPPFSGKWSKDQIYPLHTLQGFILTNINMNRLFAFSAIGLSQSGEAVIYPLTSSGVDGTLLKDITNVVSVAGNNNMWTALRADGKLIWYTNNRRSKVESLTNVVDVALGDGFLVALKGDGHVDLWSQEKLELGGLFNDIVKVDVKQTLVIALNKAGEVYAWDSQFKQKPQVCATNAVKIAASREGFAAVLTNGNILLWSLGYSSNALVRCAASQHYERISVGKPPRVLMTSNVVDLADSGYGGLALLGNGHVEINRQPIGHTVPEGMSTSFVLDVGGAWPIHVQWRHNGEEIPGATNQFLCVPFVRNDDYGYYDAVISNRLSMQLTHRVILKK